MKTSLGQLPLALVAMLALTVSSPAAGQQAFPTPDAAAQALVDALGTEHADQARLATLLGKDWRDFVPAGSVDRADVDAFLKQYRERHAIEMASAERAILSVGNDGWTLPVPIAKGAQGWRFDARAGADEMRVRRIGRNELATEEAVKTYHDAQTDYAQADHDGDGVLEYAQKILSSDGLHDGLYWSDDDSGEISPLGPLFGDAAPGSDWHGYHYRILQAQGPSAPGGAYDYHLGGNMSRGFALIAWPSKYGDSGVMSFMISHEGQIFEKDLGPASDKAARAMKTFDPDSSWTQVAAGTP